jgi:hypothetical protein
MKIPHPLPPARDKVRSLWILCAYARATALLMSAPRENPSLAPSSERRTSSARQQHQPVRRREAEAVTAASEAGAFKVPPMTIGQRLSMVCAQPPMKRGLITSM